MLNREEKSMKRNNQNIVRNSGLIVLLMLMLLTCSKDRISNVRIEVLAPRAAKSDVKITVYDILSIQGINLAEAKSDSVGFSAMEFELSKPVFADIQVCDKTTT